MGTLFYQRSKFAFLLLVLASLGAAQAYAVGGDGRRKVYNPTYGIIDKSAPTFKDSEYCSEIFRTLHEALFNSSDLNVLLRQQYGNRQFSRQLEKEILDFEKAYVELTRFAPEYRTGGTAEEVARRLQLSEKQTQDLLIYYANRTQKGPIATLSEQETAERIRILSIRYFLNTSSKTPLGRRAGYYFDYAHSKNIAEMALELKTYMGQVYEDLRVLGISAANTSWKGRWLKRDRSTWLRTGEFEGQIYLEDELMNELRHRHLDPQEIADTLNGAFKGAPRRTSESVLERMNELGLSRTVATDVDVYDSKYGYLKIGDNLIQPTVVQWVHNHPERQAKWFADQLGIDEAVFRKYMATESPFKFEEGYPVLRATTLAGQKKSNFDDQRSVVKAAAEWIKKNGGRLPEQKDFRNRSDFPFSYDKTTGINEYKDSGRKSTSRIFDSAEDFWVAVDEEVRAQTGSGIDLLQLTRTHFNNPSPTLTARMEVLRSARRVEEQSDSIQRALTWITEHPNEPLNLRKNAGAMTGIEYRRLVAQGPYKEGGELAHNHVFAQTEEFWVALAEEAQKKGLKLDLSQVIVKDRSARFLAIQNPAEYARQKEALERNLDVVVRRTQISKGIVPEVSQKEYGTTAEYWTAYLKRAKEKKVDLNLEELGKRNPRHPLLQVVEEESRTFQRKDVVARTVRWIQDHHGKLPTEFEFRGGRVQADIPYSYPAIVGRQHREGNGLFNSAEDFWAEVFREAQEQGVPVDPRKLYKSKPRGRGVGRVEEPKTLSELRQDAVDRTLDWILTHGGKLPKPKDFAARGGEIPYQYLRLVGQGNYKTGLEQQDSQIFESTSAFWEAVVREGRRRGIELDLTQLGNSMTPSWRLRHIQNQPQ